MEASLEELVSSALSPAIAADPATGAEKLVPAHSKQVHRVPYFQLAAQAEQRRLQQEQDAAAELQHQAAAATAAREAAIAVLKSEHELEVPLGSFTDVKMITLWCAGYSSFWCNFGETICLVL